ncbi:MAG TPA: alpha/beta fold hydrolase [Candidatus Hydrogenedentes bacterium]|nr:alpha/beta fold hydrolase [Candidatus Hydrogenedentota bacterium]
MIQSIEDEILESELTKKSAIMDALEAHPFEPPFWLRNAHLQTVGARYLRRIKLLPMETERWDTPDDDFVQVHRRMGDPDKPIVLMLHGLEGCVESTYMIGLIQELDRIGWSAIAMDFRSCGGPMNRAKRLYHSGETTDAEFMVRRIGELYPDSPLYMTGYSLGGNVIGKWLGDLGDKVPENVKGAAIVSAPYDLVASGKHMDSAFSRLYVLHFLRMLIPKAVEKEAQYPGTLDLEKIKKSRTFADFDTHGTAALHGFEDSHDYYTKVACGKVLHNIRQPTMLLSAKDDPFNPGETLPYEIAEKSPWLYPQFVPHGGHVGFIRRQGLAGLGYWAEEQIARFFQECHRML